MAVRPDYDIGVLNLTSGSANFTTTGSALQTAAVQAGDAIITRSGDVLIIATITGQNSGTLFQNCPASAAGAGQPLRIRFQPDGSRYQGAARDLIERLANGILDNIASIPVQNGKTLVGNNAGQYEPKDYIADNNGTLAKLAASTPAANRSLQTDNSNNIVFAPLGLELIASDTNNSEVAAWVKTGLGTTYREIFMFVDAAPVTSGGALNVQLSTDNGVTWLTATTEYTEQALVVSGTTVTAVAPSSPGIGSGATAASVGGGGAIMEIKLGEFNQFRRTMYSAFISRRVTSGAMELVTRNGIVTPWSPFNAMRLVCSNGNLARFRVVLMGVRG